MQQGGRVNRWSVDRLANGRARLSAKQWWCRCGCGGGCFTRTCSYPLQKITDGNERYCKDTFSLDTGTTTHMMSARTRTGTNVRFFLWFTLFSQHVCIVPAHRPKLIYHAGCNLASWYYRYRVHQSGRMFSMPTNGRATTRRRTLEICTSRIMFCSIVYNEVIFVCLFLFAK